MEMNKPRESDYIADYRKDKAKKSGSETVRVRKDHSLAEMLKDPQNSRLFDILLRQKNEEELAFNIGAGQLTRDDFDRLEPYRQQLSEKITRAEKIAKTLEKTGEIEEIARDHPDFK